MARKGWIIGISLALIVLVVGGLLLSGVVPLPETNASNMEIIFYDADGNELGRTDTKLSLLGIQNPGFTGDIHSLDVVVYFKVTTNSEPNYITSTCLLTIKTESNTRYGGVVNTVVEHRLGAINSDAEGSFYATYLMSQILPDDRIDAIGLESGWTVYFDATVKSNVGIDATETLNLEDTCGTTLAISWVADSATLESWFGNW